MRFTLWIKLKSTQSSFMSSWIIIQCLIIHKEQYQHCKLDTKEESLRRTGNFCDFLFFGVFKASYSQMTLAMPKTGKSQTNDLSLFLYCEAGFVWRGTGGGRIRCWWAAGREDLEKYSINGHLCPIYLKSRFVSMEMSWFVSLRVVLRVLPIQELMLFCSILAVVVWILADIIRPTIIHSLSFRFRQSLNKGSCIRASKTSFTDTAGAAFLKRRFNSQSFIYQREEHWFSGDEKRVKEQTPT